MVWLYVRERFRLFVNDLHLTDNQISDGVTKFTNVAAAVRNSYYDPIPDDLRALMVGSWGKQTQVRPPRDLDMFAVLPWDVKWRFDQRAGNVQSQLLQEVKGVLQPSYPQTDMRGDGQVVGVGFNTIMVEVVPVFDNGNGQFTMPDTNGGGSWKTVDPKAQFDRISAWDTILKGNIRPLSKMMKLWKHEQNVPIKSFIIELLMVDYMSVRSYNDQDTFWYDFYSRDFFLYLINHANQYVTIPGTYELYFLGDDWLSKAQTAYDNAVRACNHEINDDQYSAGVEWRKIYGNRIPLIW